METHGMPVYAVSLIAGRHLPGLAGLDIGHELRRIVCATPPPRSLADVVFPACDGWGAHSIVSVRADDPAVRWAAVHACRTLDTDPPTVGIDHRLLVARTHTTAVQQARSLWPLTNGWYGHGAVLCQWPPLDDVEIENTLLLDEYLRLPPTRG